jgi:hypothetical protein
MKSRLTIEQHERLHSALVQAERLAAFALANIKGQTAAQVAAAVAARAVAALRQKGGRP